MSEPSEYQAKLTNFARELRREMTVPERKLWQVLRNRKLAGFKFRRQAPIEPFIVDFLCLEKKLIVEVDGDSHIDRKSQDQVREDFLKSSGYTVVRVSNDDVLRNLEGTLMLIVKVLGVDPAGWRDGKFGQVSE